MVFTLINAVLFKPVPVPGGARLVSIISRNTPVATAIDRLSLPDFQDYRAQSHSFEGLEGVHRRGRRAQRKWQSTAVVSPASARPPASFPCCTRSPFLGRGFLARDDRPGAAPVVVIGYGVWKDRYGSARDSSSAARSASTASPPPSSASCPTASASPPAWICGCRSCPWPIWPSATIAASRLTAFSSPA